MSSSDIDNDSTISIPLVEESVKIDKRLVDGDIIKVSTRTVEHTEWVRESLVGESISVTHVPIEQAVSEIPPVREENGVTIISVVEERLVVTKTLFLLEELHIHKTQTSTPVSEPVVVRRTQATVDRTPSGRDDD